MKNKKVIIFFLIQVFFSHSQNIVNDSIKLDEVVISITKIKDSIKKSPFAISAFDFTNFQSTAQQFYLSEFLERTPGVFISNDNNFQIILILNNAYATKRKKIQYCKTSFEQYTTTLNQIVKTITFGPILILDFLQGYFLFT